MTAKLQSPAERKEAKKLNDSYLFCRNLARKNSNFYLGMALASKEKSNAILSMYAWLHSVDDIADNQKKSKEKRLRELKQFHKITIAVLNNEKNISKYKRREKYWLAFRKTVLHYHIPRSYLVHMVAGQRQDMLQSNYHSFRELYKYCRLVASMVGLIVIQIGGYTNAKAKQLAEWAGIALQLTNILRDIQEDASRKRVYLPAEFVGIKELTAEDLLRMPHKSLLRGVNKLIARNQTYYKKTAKLYGYLNKDIRLSCLIIIHSYYAIFEKIRANPEIVLSGNKVKLNFIEKLWVVFNTFFKYQSTTWRR